MKWNVQKLKRGDHIRVKRDFYYHHGVYIGDNKVIHFSAEKDDGIYNPEMVFVIESEVSFFAKDNIVEVASLSFKEKLFARSKSSSVKRAKKALGNKGYDFLHNNCETFANNCCYRKILSCQIRSFKDQIKDLK